MSHSQNPKNSEVDAYSYIKIELEKRDFDISKLEEEEFDPEEKLHIPKFEKKGEGSE